MKTFKSTVILAAVSAALIAIPTYALTTPHVSGWQTVLADGTPDQNLLANPRAGKHTLDAAISSPVGTTPNLVSAIERCPMIPKSKGTASCEAMCGSTGCR